MRTLQMFDAVLPGLLAASICLGVACTSPPAGTDVTGSSARAATTTAPGSGAPVAASLSPLPATTNAATVGSLEVPEMGSVAYTIDLPAGLIKTSGDRPLTSYARSGTDERGPIVEMSPDVGSRMTLADAVREAQQTGLDVVKSERIGAGWLVTTVNPKEKVVSVRRLVDGAPGIFCTASSKGDDVMGAKNSSLAVLENVCRSVAIKKS